MKNVKIIADSSANLLEISDIAFESIPMKIITHEKEYTDNSALDTEKTVSELENYKGKSSTSCPNTSEWLNAFGEAEEIFCITISGALSGSYNSARAAKNVYEEKHPDKHVFVLDSLSTGPETALIIEYFRAAMLNGYEFENACREAEKYLKHGTALLFMLESMKNLADNGRVSHIVAKAAGLLGIRIVGMADSHGRLKLLSKCRGEKKALEGLLRHMEEIGYNGGAVKIDHCLNLSAAEQLKALICEKYKSAKTEINECRGLCSFYAERGGLIVGFEKSESVE